jgi:hypothetical protein
MLQFRIMCNVVVQGRIRYTPMANVSRETVDQYTLDKPAELRCIYFCKHGQADDLVEGGELKN